MAALEVTGSNLDDFECPWCGATDRERHLSMYMEACGLLDTIAGKDILHFAPERRIEKLLADKLPGRHVKADIFPSSPDVQRIDIMQIPYPDQSFDLVIANHVLEHVESYPQCLKEVRRVLRIGGLAILQTPYSSKLEETWSDQGIDDDASRLHAYGQEDHVRLFGKDIFARIASSGLTSRVRNHGDLLPHIDASKFGVNHAEPFFLYERTD
jgi:SAM-dependent methyltransferase